MGDHPQNIDLIHDRRIPERREKRRREKDEGLVKRRVRVVFNEVSTREAVFEGLTCGNKRGFHR